MSDDDAMRAVKILLRVPKTYTDEYRQAQPLLAQIRKRFPRAYATAKADLANDSTLTAESATTPPESSFPDEFIRRKLTRDYPDDYVTQKGVYEMQLEAFGYMKTLPASRIKSKVQRDYPNDFVTQKGVYDMQIEAREQMELRKRP